ncbi:MAG TPA: prephenate dehydratase domain-containing protein, partial [Gemmata sp.]|nr:prephenate dehydratase domain-containing protein [Gemmata sp.]
ASTADAAKLVQTDMHAAAVASRKAAVNYGINILAHNIEDSPFNETRFAVIGPSDSTKTGHDKTAMMFQISHTPGALADVLGVFKTNKLNLTWIESFPYREAKGEYVFFLDFDGHREDPKVKKTISSLESICDVVQVLGSFPHAQPADE